MVDKSKSYKGAAVGGNLYRHIWLSGQVARSVGVNLREALRSGKLNSRQYSEVISRCQNSDCDKACALHMSALPNGRQDNVQGFCANQRLFESLRITDEDHAALAARENQHEGMKREA